MRRPLDMADRRKQVEGVLSIAVGVGCAVIARQIYLLDPSLFGKVRDCLLYLMIMEMLILGFLGVCLYTCGLKGEDRCTINCLRLFVYMQFAVLAMFFACMAANAGIF